MLFSGGAVEVLASECVTCTDGGFFTASCKTTSLSCCVGLLSQAMRIPVGREKMRHSTNSYWWKVPLYSIHARECQQDSSHQGNVSTFRVMSNCEFRLHDVARTTSTFSRS